MSKTNKTVAVGMSGGVDSTIAIALLQEKGYKVSGITMSFWEEATFVEDKAVFTAGCFTPLEKGRLENIKKLCAKFGIAHHTIDLQKEYKKCVLDYFTSTYTKGKTPNPCVMCNKFIKFGAFFKTALKQGVDAKHFATGHYARVGFSRKENRFVLKKALDKQKDQTYFLWALSQDILSKVIFPLGNMTKKETFAMAKKLGLKMFDEKKESQDFIPPSAYKALFKGKKFEVGDIVDTSGKKVGTHKGIIYYTVGQRRGLGIGGILEPIFVKRIDAKNNLIVVCKKEELYSCEMNLCDVNWVSINEPKGKIVAKIKIRQQHLPATADIFPMPNNKAKVVFKKPQLLITSGQSAVFYKGDILLGGGIIV
ncbi:MAG: tRNA 2-thiouridine(34) synthase MnmA [Elusimicrobiaceae bacterium]|nr:tRNA 2-thiouridine(34) synthase MnmA [Elusimicrobiaceae bacterium]